MNNLWWYPSTQDWRNSFAALSATPEWSELRRLSLFNLDFLQTSQLERRLLKIHPADGVSTVKLAILSTSTMEQLHPGIRIAALRRDLALKIYQPDFGQVESELLDRSSGLHRFQPNVVLLQVDAYSAAGMGLVASSNAAHAHFEQVTKSACALWKAAKEAFDCHVLQQTVVPVHPTVIGEAEHRAAGAPASLVSAINARLRELSDTHGVDLVSLDSHLVKDGLDAWHSPALWHRAKQELSPTASPLYGELVLRVIEARAGKSRKCLVLDLDNTLWGGVIGDDGLAGIELGQGSAAGEAFLSFQHYVKALSERGVILAVCSKNDETNAFEAFDRHPEMALRRSDIACFAVNWDDKATNMRRIAAQIDIGIDSLVFVDDNAFERNLVRTELPMVAVPELPDDPALFARCLSDAGYFEATGITAEDVSRSSLYQANATLRAAETSVTDLNAYLKTLQMEVHWGSLDEVSWKRVTQLINKTNQFNLTTRRYTEAETAAIMRDPSALCLHFRLVDRLADHGVIAVIVGHIGDDSVLEIDNWLMSCRVLRRQVESACFAILANVARARGALALRGSYRPSAKNSMVKEHYHQFGFRLVAEDADHTTTWERDISDGILSPIVFDIREIQS